MQCTQCGQINQSAKFCVKCGVNLQAAATSEAADHGYRPPVQPPLQAEQLSKQQSNQPAAFNHNPAAAQPNPQLQQAKQISKQYLAYFAEVLKSPTRTGQNSTAGHMVNGLITLILFSLLLPLIAYVQLHNQGSRFGFGFQNHISFGSVVIKPFFFLFIIVMLVNSVIFLVLKLGNAGASYREVTARFGTFMIPSVAFYLVAFLFSLVSDGSLMMSLLIALGLFSWFVAVCLVIYSFKKDHSNGLDAFYGVILTYIASIILIALLGEDIASTVFRGVGNPLHF